MAKTGSALTLGFAIASIAVAMVACSDDPADKIGARGGAGKTGSSSGDPNDPNNPNGPGGEQIAEEQKAFFELQPDLEKKCGNVCHNQGTYRPEPPKFLAGATPTDVYKTIKAHPGIVVRDVYASVLLTKGPHAGPALNTDPEFEKKVVAWLELESIAIQSQKLPTTEPVTVTFGSTYTAENLKSAIEGLTGKKVTIAKWGYDPYAGIYSDPVVYPAPVGQPDEAGFQVIFAGDPDPYTDDSDRMDMRALIVKTSDGVGARVGETAKGGPANNNGETHRTGNRAPSVTGPAGRTLPLRTPFTLRGSGTDPDGDKLTYLWEQNDVGGVNGTALVDNKKVDGPLFRVFGHYADVSDENARLSPSPGQNQAGYSPSRTFPDMEQILAGNTNAKTGTCPPAPPNNADTYVVVPLPIVNCYSEFLPVKGYVGNAGSKTPAMHFRLTARDTVAGGGGVSYADLTLRLDPNAGPFLVSSFAKGGSVKAGSKQTITWKVNRTRKLAKNVKILLSTDNGKTWSKVLVNKTANDGRVRVKLPKKVKTTQARIMIRAIDNYFFDVNDSVFRIR